MLKKVSGLKYDISVEGFNVFKDGLTTVTNENMQQRIILQSAKTNGQDYIVDVHRTHDKKESTALFNICTDLKEMHKSVRDGEGWNAGGKMFPAGLRYDCYKK